jgi:hypothetical protein
MIMSNLWATDQPVNYRPTCELQTNQYSEAESRPMAQPHPFLPPAVLIPLQDISSSSPWTTVWRNDREHRQFKAMSVVVAKIHGPSFNNLTTTDLIAARYDV